MLHILHAADLHLDAPFAALSAGQARQRRSEQRLLPDKLADTAIERGADLVLLSGDLLDSEQTYRETAQALASALGRIDAPVAIAPGNHDFYSPSSLYAAPIWPKNVLIFRDSRVQSVELEHCTLYGCAFTGQYRDGSPLAGFRAPDSGKPSVMVCHGDVNGTGRYAPIPTQEIEDSGLTYLALGHVHTYSGLQKAGNTSWAYPGCTEGRGFDEPGEKGALWVTIDGNNTVTAEFLPLAERRYEILACDLTAGDPVGAVTDALTSQGSEKDITRLILTGESEGVDLPALTKTARAHRWAVTLRDHTRIPHDLWRREAEDSLTGLFLRDMRRRIDGAQGEEKVALEKAVRFGLAALENGEDTL